MCVLCNVCTYVYVCVCVCRANSIWLLVHDLVTMTVIKLTDALVIILNEFGVCGLLCTKDITSTLQ